LVSPLFRRLWRMPEFSLRGYGIHRFTHPRFGKLGFEHASCTPDGHPGIRVVICTPCDAATRRAIAQASAEQGKAAVARGPHAPVLEAGNR
jgi:hypothetical protein